MKKKFIYRTTFLFSLIMIFICIKSYANNSDYTYELDSNNYATITAYKGTSGEITIPNTIDGHHVKKIGAHAFNENRNTTNGKILTNVIIEEGITEIGDFAFLDCLNLESVTLPESLTQIGWQCFQECSKLNKINIPSKLTSFAPYTFQNTGFSEFIIPENINQLNSCVFRSCNQLKIVVVYNANLQYYTTLQSGQVIDEKPFEYCSEDLVLYGYPNSTTEEYANKNGFIFKDISTYSTDIAISSINLNKKSISLNVGETETIIATILPENATNKTIIWSSDNENVAKVKEGKITAISEGIVIITATSSDGKIKDTCEVTVKKDEEKTSVNKVEKDKSTAPKELPKTGKRVILITLIIFTICIAIVFKVNSEKYRDIH